MRWFLPLTVAAGCAEEAELPPPGTSGPGLLALTGQQDESTTTADAVVQQADLFTVREGADIQVVVAEDITHDMYGRPLSELAVPRSDLTICMTLVPPEEVVEEVRNTPMGTRITCPESYSMGWTEGSLTVRGEVVHDTILLDLIYGVPGTHEYYHFIEVVTADPNETNTELEIR